MKLLLKVEVENKMVEIFDTTKIKMSQDNPKRVGSKIYDKYETYKNVTTVKELITTFGPGWKSCVKYDLPRGFMTIVK